MKNFFDALISESKNSNLPEEYDFFSGLVGSWRIEYIDKKLKLRIKANGISRACLTVWLYRT